MHTDAVREWICLKLQLRDVRAQQCTYMGHKKEHNRWQVALAPEVRWDACGLVRHQSGSCVVASTAMTHTVLNLIWTWVCGAGVQHKSSVQPPVPIIPGVKTLLFHKTKSRVKEVAVKSGPPRVQVARCQVPRIQAARQSRLPQRSPDSEREQGCMNGGGSRCPPVVC